MTEPTVFGLPISIAFLYFITYSVLGWCMETIYCSVKERRLVPRGFLYGPMCPIYGVGALMMICWFQPLMGNPALFYVAATVCMSAWEYFVGWFLETATHVKYWDYSDVRWNLQGRICLPISLTWGALSFVVLYFIHPRVSEHLGRIPAIPLYVLDGFFLGVLVSDATATIYQLARTSQMLTRLQQAGDELRLQASLGRAELSDRLDQAREAVSGRLEDLLPDQLDERGRALKERYDDLMVRAEVSSRRFRKHYSGMTAQGPAAEALESVKRHAERMRVRFTRPSQKTADKSRN